MCAGAATINNACTVKDRTYRLYKDTRFKNTDLVSLTLTNTKIICQKKDDTFCAIDLIIGNQERPLEAVKDTETDQQEVGADGATTPAAEEAPKIIMPLLSMLESTEIRARRVAVIVPNGRLVIDGSSAINADGSSGNIRGTSMSQGASFIGQHSSMECCSSSF